jgi:hypothetical protein
MLALQRKVAGQARQQRAQGPAWLLVQQQLTQQLRKQPHPEQQCSKTQAVCLMTLQL